MGLIYSLQRRNREPSCPEQILANRERVLTHARLQLNEGSYFHALRHVLLNWEDIMNSWQQMCFLYVSILLLSITGGAIFYVAEYNAEADLLQERQDFLNHLQYTYQNNTAQLDMIMNWGNEAYEFVYPTDEFPNGRNKWEFRYSCFFAATTFTTNGFGLQAPVTFAGRLATMIYCLPSIACYVYISQAIGDIVLSLFASGISRCGCINYDYYMANRLSIVGALAIGLSLFMAGVIYSIRTDEGFGNGVYTYFDAVYFLFQTTMTIGYGDVMMSGGNPIGTMLLGCWLATSIGVFVRLLSQLEHTVIDEPKKLKKKVEEASNNKNLEDDGLPVED